MSSPDSIHPVFASISMSLLNQSTYESTLEAHREELVGVFFWGHQCPNCEVAKAMLHQDAARVNALGIRWFHVNVYQDFDLATRYGLHGIPAFFFFLRGRTLGKISPFPGMEPFMEALTSLTARHPSESRAPSSGGRSD